MTVVRAGFLPLLDAAILIAAHEVGFAAEQGIELTLARETSWANIRDRVSVGQFDVAHMLAPLPVAQNLGLSPLNVRLIAPFALGLGGNAVTVSTDLFDAMTAHGADRSGEPRPAGTALRAVVWQRQTSGAPQLTFAVVHDYSAHAYELRYWLASCGINPVRDVAIAIVPPSMMCDALASGAIDGYCVGEPWNSVAVAAGAGVVVTTKAAIWQSSPEKVLGMKESWAAANPELLARLLLALHRSAAWCSSAENRETLCAILARDIYIGQPEEILYRGLSGNLASVPARPDFLMFAERGANFPWQSHAMWYYSQMVRWGQLPFSHSRAKIARLTYRPDLYRSALGPHGIALPGASAKVEGALSEITYVPAAGGRIALGPDGFFDGVSFDPDRLEDYIEASPFYSAMHNK
jgi:NitT/TauT family transport system ATP-binding protein